MASGAGPRGATLALGLQDLGGTSEVRTPHTGASNHDDERSSSVQTLIRDPLLGDTRTPPAVIGEP
jgi:hypothetical protein